MPHFLEVIVAHVVEAQRKAVLVVGNRLSDILEQLLLLLARLLGDLREVVRLCSL